ncbi:MAG: 2OG-Fe(II) oxygenase [Pseudomonadota bacterium]
MNYLDENKLDNIADALVECGYLVIDDFLPVDLLQGLMTHFLKLDTDVFKSAGIGRQANFHVQGQIRSDKIHWLESNTKITTEFLRYMEVLSTGLNRRLFLGLSHYESHFAHYPVGAFYKKHMDAFRDNRELKSLPSLASNRLLSTVLYLNENWLAQSGGELVIYDESDDQILEKILPEFGRLVIFLSEKFPHEVLPATRERNSIAGWFRVIQ